MSGKCGLLTEAHHAVRCSGMCSKKCISHRNMLVNIFACISLMHVCFYSADASFFSFTLSQSIVLRLFLLSPRVINQLWAVLTCLISLSEWYAYGCMGFYFNNPRTETPQKCVMI